jgi:peptidoglycan/LPS O-acetylase OafA/YrhL
MSSSTVVRSESNTAVEAHIKRIPSLDGLRALSITLVFAGHVYMTTGYPSNRLTAFLGSFSHFGVQVFFVISGFLISSLLLEEKRSKGFIDLRSFYLRRSFRIFPAAFAYIMFATAIRFVLHHPFPLKYLVVALTYTTCYFHGGPWVLAHLWSLSVEEQFYLFWPLALVIVFGIRKQTCWAIMVVAPIARIIYMKYAPISVEYVFPAVADSLAAGCLLALYRSELLRIPKWVYSTPIAVALSVAAFASNEVYSRSVLLWGAVPLIIAIAVHIAVVRKDWVLNNRVAVYLGSLSYSLYLFQQPFLTQSTSTNRWSSFPINIILAIFLALLSHYVIEKPLILVGKRISARRSLKSNQVELVCN